MNNYNTNNIYKDLVRLDEAAQPRLPATMYRAPPHIPAPIMISFR